MRRAHAVLDLGRVYPTPPGKAGDKPQWRLVLNERETYAVLAAIWPWLMSRRQARATEALLRFRDRPRRYLVGENVRSAVRADRAATGASQWTLAHRHGISRSLVQQILAE